MGTDKKNIKLHIVTDIKKIITPKIVFLIMGKQEKVIYYLLHCTSWEEHEKLSDISYYSKSIYNNDKGSIKSLKTCMDINVGKKMHKCTYCEKEFNIKTGLTRHTRVHTGEKPYKCNYCQKEFAVKSTLVTHTRIHTGEKPFKCVHCQKDFVQKNQLVSHLRIHTDK